MGRSFTCKRNPCCGEMLNCTYPPQFHEIRKSKDTAMTAIDEIAAERRRQTQVEGWTPDHDDGHDAMQMASAAAAYIHSACFPNDQERGFQRYWPWDRSWWKPKDRRRDLIRAGALILAKIERMDRAALRAKGDEHGAT